METPTELAHGLRSLSTPEELIGALQSNFGTVMPQPEADAYTESIELLLMSSFMRNGISLKGRVLVRR